MPTTYDDVTGVPTYKFPTETKEDFDAINAGSELISMQAALESLIDRWETVAQAYAEDDPRQQILASMRELADRMRAVNATDSVPEANTD